LNIIGTHLLPADVLVDLSDEIEERRPLIPSHPKAAIFINLDGDDDCVIEKIQGQGQAATISCIDDNDGDDDDDVVFMDSSSTVPAAIAIEQNTNHGTVLTDGFIKAQIQQDVNTDSHDVNTESHNVTQILVSECVPATISPIVPSDSTAVLEAQSSTSPSSSSSSSSSSCISTTSSSVIKNKYDEDCTADGLKTTSSNCHPVEAEAEVEVEVEVEVGVEVGVPCKTSINKCARTNDDDNALPLRVQFSSTVCGAAEQDRDDHHLAIQDSNCGTATADSGLHSRVTYSPNSRSSSSCGTGSGSGSHFILDMTSNDEGGDVDEYFHNSTSSGTSSGSSSSSSSSSNSSNSSSSSSSSSRSSGDTKPKGLDSSAVSSVYTFDPDTAVGVNSIGKDEQASHPVIRNGIHRNTVRSEDDVICISESPPRSVEVVIANKEEEEAIQGKSAVEYNDKEKGYLDSAITTATSVSDDRDRLVEVEDEDDDEDPVLILSSCAGNNPTRDRTSSSTKSSTSQLASTSNPTPTLTPTPTSTFIPSHAIKSNTTLVPTATLDLTPDPDPDPDPYFEPDPELLEDDDGSHKEDGRTVLLFILQEVIEKSGLISLLDRHLRNESLLDIENHSELYYLIFQVHKCVSVCVCKCVRVCIYVCKYMYV
jgi:hypothetical protein